MTKENVKAKSSPLGILENCRVVEIGIDGYAECIPQGLVPCSRALLFDNHFLCTHPRLDEMIENTKKAQQAIKI